MKKIQLLVTTLASAFTLATAPAATFEDVQFWVGTGSHRAALVIDWNDGKTAESLLWGYRWDGAATGFDMFQAVVSADPRLFAHLGTFSFGTAVMGIGYDLNASGGFDVNPALNFAADGWRVDPGTDEFFDDARVATDADDHYREGWSSGYWSYYVKATTEASWGYASSGASDRVLSDGAWDGWSFAPNFADSAPSAPIAAVPEPATLTLAWLGGALWLRVRRRRHSDNGSGH